MDRINVSIKPIQSSPDVPSGKWALAKIKLVKSAATNVGRARLNLDILPFLLDLFAVKGRIVARSFGVPFLRLEYRKPLTSISSAIGGSITRLIKVIISWAV